MQTTSSLVYWFNCGLVSLMHLFLLQIGAEDEDSVPTEGMETMMEVSFYLI